MSNTLPLEGYRLAEVERCDHCGKLARMKLEDVSTRDLDNARAWSECGRTIAADNENWYQWTQYKIAAVAIKAEIERRSEKH